MTDVPVSSASTRALNTLVFYHHLPTCVSQYLHAREQPIPCIVLEHELCATGHDTTTALGREQLRTTGHSSSPLTAHRSSSACRQYDDSNNNIHGTTLLIEDRMPSRTEKDSEDDYVDGATDGPRPRDTTAIQSNFDVHDQYPPHQEISPTAPGIHEQPLMGNEDRPATFETSEQHLNLAHTFNGDDPPPQQYYQDHHGDFGQAFPMMPLHDDGNIHQSAPTAPHYDLSDPTRPHSFHHGGTVINDMGTMRPGADMVSNVGSHWRTLN